MHNVRSRRQRFDSVSLLIRPPSRSPATGIKPVGSVNKRADFGAHLCIRIVHELYGTRRTFAHADSAALAYGRFNIGRAHDIPDAGQIWLDHWHAKWADAHAGQAARAKRFVDYMRPGLRLSIVSLLRYPRGARCSSLGLDERFIQQLGIMRHAGHENAVRAEIYRA